MGTCRHTSLKTSLDANMLQLDLPEHLEWNVARVIRVICWGDICCHPWHMSTTLWDIWDIVNYAMLLIAIRWHKYLYQVYYLSYVIGIMSLPISFNMCHIISIAYNKCYILLVLYIINSIFHQYLILSIPWIINM